MEAVRMTDGGAQPPASDLGPGPRRDVTDAVADVAFQLVGQLADCVLVVRPVAGTSGPPADFVIDHVNPGFADPAPAGRGPGDLVGQRLRAAYPGGGFGEILLATAQGVLATGAPLHVPGFLTGIPGLDEPAAARPADLRAAPFAGRVVLTWRRVRGGTREGLPSRLTDYRTRRALAETRDLLADSEQRAAEQHELAVRLQRAIMPSSGHRAVPTPGVDIAVRYRPAVAGSLVAGDWYDIMELPGGDLLLVVGDIAGHGIDAVTGMVAARNALRGLAVTGASPNELISHLNVGMCNYTEGHTGTVICCRYSPDSGLLRWARAGHLPPFLVRGGVAEALPLPDGLLLGMDDDARYQEVVLQLRSGDTLLLYTDGLVERRAASISDALADFAAAAVPAGPDADATATRILAQASADTGDDACLVAVQIR
jgi:serine phosphatase RsbU (regulator of sigma subunit)